VKAVPYAQREDYSIPVWSVSRCGALNPDANRAIERCWAPLHLVKLEWASIGGRPQPVAA
jgi:hypothetical protein